MQCARGVGWLSGPAAARQYVSRGLQEAEWALDRLPTDGLALCKTKQPTETGIDGTGPVVQLDSGRSLSVW